VAIALAVQADVIDITKDSPQAGDCFLVDTNVWFWLAYTKASMAGAKAHQVASYPPYLSKALSVAATLAYSALTLGELAATIERAERDIFNLSNPALNPKEFRHNNAAVRKNVTDEIGAAFIQIDGIAAMLNTNVDAKATQAASIQIAATAMDFVDALMLRLAVENKMTQVLTDDCDWACVPGIQVYTANATVLSAAAAQGRVLTR
jgi:predicted nucleic acid-binding protein